MKGLVYISGPITGHANYKAVFAYAEAYLLGLGYDVFNPASVDEPDWTWSQYMQYDIAKLRECDYIYMLPKWEHSKGARIERRYAKRHGIQELIFEALDDWPDIPHSISVPKRSKYTQAAAFKLWQDLGREV